MWHLIFNFRQATHAVIFRLMSIGLRSPNASRKAWAAEELGSIMLHYPILGFSPTVSIEDVEIKHEVNDRPATNQ